MGSSRGGGWHRPWGVMRSGRRSLSDRSLLRRGKVSQLSWSTFPGLSPSDTLGKRAGDGEAFLSVGVRGRGAREVQGSSAERGTAVKPELCHIQSERPFQHPVIVPAAGLGPLTATL